MAPTHVLLMRHGETDASAAGLFSGLHDVPLSEKGLSQARRWARFFAGLDATRSVHCSPLQRARQTAVAAGLTHPPTLTDLREWDLGELEGTSSDGFRREHPGWSLFREGPPNGTGESPEVVVQRARRVRESIESGSFELCVLVSHGQFLRALTCVLLDVPLATAAALSFGPARAGLVTMRANGRYSLTGWNLAAPDPAAALEGLT